MKFGINTFPTDFGMQPDELARTVEALGFESLLFAEHTHIPTSRISKFPYGEDISQAYWRNLDPFIASLSLQLPQTTCSSARVYVWLRSDPITLAKQVSTLDHLSNGRFLFGVGAGWNLEEMENHGTVPNQRWKMMRERIEALVFGRMNPLIMASL
jgi:alkanesulfonate monooxygenase SsuD/methylene tetrahydromethanopterin reductase-like flavin-dependent oxidoreductase (luciferase family)